MVYLVNLRANEVERVTGDIRIHQRLTKAFPSRVSAPNLVPRLALVLAPALKYQQEEHDDLILGWIGLVRRWNTPGPVDTSITIDPLRECHERVLVTGAQGLLADLPETCRSSFEDAVASGDVSYCDSETWNAVADAIRTRHPSLAPLIDWLVAQADAPILGSQTPEDRSWQEQQDAARTALRMGGFPHSAFAAWQRPPSRDAPYLSGLIPEPPEQALIEHDSRTPLGATGFFQELRDQDQLSCAIHVLSDSDDRQLEVANVNATPVEARTGTDLIYYHGPTHSFVLVQYKRLDTRTRSIHVDDRLRRQLDRLDTVAGLSSAPERPSDWRLGGDPCFLKLAYWPEGGAPSHELTPGMYLPLSYVRLLLADDCTRGRQDGRFLSYERVQRYLVGTQFIDLVKHGFAGTVGTTREQLLELGTQRAENGQSVVVAAESSSETSRERQQRTQSRGRTTTNFRHDSY